MDFLKDYRSYIIAAAVAIVTGLEIAGVIPTEIANQIRGMLGAGAIFTLRAAMVSPVDVAKAVQNPALTIAKAEGPKTSVRG